MANRRIDQAGSIESHGLREKRMLVRRPQVFANLPPETSVRLTAVWCGAVGGMLLIMILIRLFS